MRKPSNKQVLFTPTYGVRKSRRSKSFLPFFVGLLVGVGGYWFVQTNYLPNESAEVDTKELTKQIEVLKYEKEALVSQVHQAQADALVLKAKIEEAEKKKLQAEESSKNLNPIIPVAEEGNNDSIEALLKTLPEDTSSSPIGIRLAEFSGYKGRLNYKLILSEKDKSITERPIRIEILTTGKYMNGNNGFENIKSIEAVSGQYTNIQNSAELTKRTLTPHKVELKLYDKSTNKLITKREYEVVQQSPEANSNSENQN